MAIVTTQASVAVLRPCASLKTRFLTGSTGKLNKEVSFRQAAVSSYKSFKLEAKKPEWLPGLASPAYLNGRQCSGPRFSKSIHQIETGKSSRASRIKVKAFLDLPLMAVMVEQMEGQRDLITHKSIWHLSDEAMKNVYTLYIMFTCWGCCFFGSTKDPYYDSEEYRKDGGDGSGHWVYEKQEDIEESSRAELWREELIEEIEQKVGSLRELEEAGKKEELVK